MKIDTFLVVDFEATCDDRGSVPRNEMEIIEVGAVRVDGPSLTSIGEFQLFVRPVRHPRLTRFCQDFTSIAQVCVDRAPSFKAVAAALEEWASADAGTAAFCSWGNYDRKQLTQDCSFHRISNPLPDHHINLKAEFARQQGLSRGFGMAQALRYVGLSLSGTHHRGIDDARNIARLVPFALGLKGVHSGAGSGGQQGCSADARSG